MKPYDRLEHPDITRALISGGRYWDEKSELEWEKQFREQGIKMKVSLI